MIYDGWGLGPPGLSWAPGLLGKEGESWRLECTGPEPVTPLCG